MNSGGVSPPRAAAQKTWKPGGSGSASSPLPFPAGGEGLHHLQKNKTPKPVDFNFSFFFGSVSVFSFLDLLHLRSFFCLHLLLFRFRWPAVGRRCSVQRVAVNLWPVWTALPADSVDGADGSVCVLLDGLHSCRW
jgi:hypothetical protein